MGIGLFTQKRYNFKPVVICQEIGVFKHEEDLGIHSWIAIGSFIHEQLLIYYRGIHAEAATHMQKKHSWAATHVYNKKNIHEQRLM